MMKTNSLKCFRLLAAGALFLMAYSTPLHADLTYTPGQKVTKTFKGFAQPFLDNYCVDCHDEDKPKGNISLHDLGPVDETNSGIWKSVWAQVALKEMPPKKKSQPEVAERLLMEDWIVGEMKRVMKDKGGFKAHLAPNKANFVDHDLLFGELPSSVKLQPTSTPARIWRVTPQEHITRLNELINNEPAYDPKKPGVRTKGDVVPTNHGGELKMYFGIDRYITSTGGTVSYATSVKSIPVVLASKVKYGLENYPYMYSVNSSEAMQIADKANSILRYMAYGPLSIAEPWQISDKKGALQARIKSHNLGDIRGQPINVQYSTKVVRPITPLYDLMENPGVSDSRLREVVDFLFEALTFRVPTREESDNYLAIVKKSVDQLGKEDGVFLGLQAIFLDRDALFRPELVEKGTPDRHGRVMMQDWELGLAVNHALRYIKPDEQLKQAIVSGKMRTKADVKREVERMLNDDSIRKPRVLRFFKDFFDYDLAGKICKDAEALKKAGGGKAYQKTMLAMSASTDRLVELILKEDKDVLKQLLTTDKVVVSGNDKHYFGEFLSNKAVPKKDDAWGEKKPAPQKPAPKKKTKKKKDDYSVNTSSQSLLEFDLGEISTTLAPKEDAEKKPLSKRELKKKKAREAAARRAAAKKKAAQEKNNSEAAKKAAEAKKADDAKKKAEAAKKKAAAAKKKKKKNAAPSNVKPADFKGPKIYARVSHKSFGGGSMKPERILSTVPKSHRLGILTHPSWLVSHSDAMDNHAIHRGIWVRERLLGGGIPDVPITVDAMLPDEPHHTLRERMRVTKEDYCWTCHEKMDPLGLAFEMYNHIGLYRTTELKKPVDTTGEIIDSGDPKLDGPVKNAIEMIQKLSESERVEQVFVRHAFRFWMGRNETLNDRQTLQDAYYAYKESGGSMNALIVSLLTSDAFLYRTRVQ